MPTDYDDAVSAELNVGLLLHELDAIAAAPSRQPAWRVRSTCSEAAAFIRAHHIDTEEV